MVRLRRIAVAVIVCAALVGAAVAFAGPTAGGPETLRPVPGSGEFRFSGKGTFGDVTGTATTKVIPAAITPGEPVRFIVDIRWTETDQNPSCSYGSDSGATPSQTVNYQQVPLTAIRPGHGEDLSVGRVTDARADLTGRINGATWACGPPNHITRNEGYEARVPGSATANYAPGCYAPFPSAGSNTVSYLGPNATFEGSFATLSVGGVNCTGGGATAPQTFTDSFNASGQARPHAVAVPPKKTRAEVTLRWTKPGDRFTVAGVVLTPKRTTASVGRAEKLKITFFSLTPTSVGVRISFLTPGKLTFRVVGKTVSGRATVRTRVVLKA